VFRDSLIFQSSRSWYTVNEFSVLPGEPFNSRRVTSVFLISYICKSAITVRIALATSSEMRRHEDANYEPANRFRRHTVRMAELTRSQKTGGAVDVALNCVDDGRDPCKFLSFIRGTLILLLQLSLIARIAYTHSRSLFLPIILRFYEDLCGTRRDDAIKYT
jgi:hypothetical protein